MQIQILRKMVLKKVDMTDEGCIFCYIGRNDKSNSNHTSEASRERVNSTTSLLSWDRFPQCNNTRKEKVFSLYCQSKLTISLHFNKKNVYWKTTRKLWHVIKIRANSWFWFLKAEEICNRKWILHLNLRRHQRYLPSLSATIGGS